MGSGQIGNPTSEAYCETIAEMQTRCEELDLNFRVVMMTLAEAWLEVNPSPGTTTNEEQDDETGRGERGPCLDQPASGHIT